MRNPTVCMLDVETLGKRPGCKILTIGAITFDRDGLRTDGAFYERIDRAKWYGGYFHEDGSTVEWWSQQSAEARAEAFGGDAYPLMVIGLWQSYVSRIKPDLIYCKGASFDFPIMIAAGEWYGYDQEEILPYRTLRCMRGLAALGGVNVAEFDLGVAHNALDDARHQAMVVHRALTNLGAWDRL